MELFQQAADQDNARAQYLLGQCYEHGQGVAKDLSRAMELYHQAADGGSKDAKERLEKGHSAKGTSGQEAPKQEKGLLKKALELFKK